MKKRICNRIQTTLATAGPEALRQDKNAQRHLEECTECFAILESLHELDLHLESLPAIDAPDEAVAALLAQPEIVAGPSDSANAATSPSERAPWWSRLRPHFESGRRAGVLAWGSGAAATLVLIIGFSVSLDRFFPEKQVAVVSDPERVAVPVSRVPPPPIKQQAGNKRVQSRVQPGAPTDPSVRDERANGPTEGNESFHFRAGDDESELKNRERGAYELGKHDQSISRADDEFIADLPVPGRFYRNILHLAPGAQDADGDGNPNVHGARDRDFKAIVGGVSTEAEEELAAELSSLGYVGSTGNTAREFLEARRSFDGLSYRPARGYWANSYVPGDPLLRLLQTRLLAGGGRWLDPSTSRRLSLHDASRRTIQPFDPPQNSALAIYLHADRTGLESEGRMLVQVGIEATERHAGRRPSMNVGVVLDLRGEITAEAAASVRALVEALDEARQPGDRFGIFVAGRSGGRVVAPENFKHGYLTVTLGRLLGDEAGVEGPLLGIEEAMAGAIQDVAGVDDPDAPLGSSAVLLITGGSFGGSTRALTDMAHQSAVAGVPVSVIGIGAKVRTDEIERLTLAGQGNRRLLASAAEASDLVDRELSAVSRAVARAVRLRIRLAPGVRLIDVIGSERLDEAGAQRVRDAEKSVDLRLARSLGIEADRGEDEDGLQIVIPSFYAGDSHVILLDVVAPGPGPLVDVVARYKDLAHLNNGVARASLAVGNDEGAAGPLERNVLKNYLAVLLSDTLEQAGNDLTAGNRSAALERLAAFRDLLEGLRVELPGLDHDAETIADIAMLDEYATLLNSGAVDRPEHLAYLSNSLRYAARLKLLAAPSLN